jgi:hypothetical protein
MSILNERLMSVELDLRLALAKLEGLGPTTNPLREQITRAIRTAEELVSLTKG